MRGWSLVALIDHCSVYGDAGEPGEPLYGYTGTPFTPVCLHVGVPDIHQGWGNPKNKSYVALIVFNSFDPKNP